MNSAFAVARRELRTFFASPIAYIVLGGFLVLTGWFFFAPLFLRGEASLRGFFDVAKWCFLLFVPAVTMRAIAEERKSGTLELLLTMPVQDWQVVLGKFIASLAMVCAGLLFTLPYALTVSSLTAPGTAFDWGPVLAGYVGLTLLAAAMIALGLWASALSKNQIVGFVVGLVVCAAFLLIDKFAVLLPEGMASIVDYVSLDYHFESITRGVFDTRDLLYYLSITGAGLVLTTQLLGNIRREMNTSAVASPTVFTLAVVGSLVLVNVLSLRLFTRFDVTADHAYTLAAASKETLAKLDDQVTVTAYFTQDLPAPYSSSSRYVRDLLEEFRAASKGKLSFEFIDPAAQETDKDKEAKREVKQDIFGRRFREPTAQEKELAQAGIQAVEIRVVQDDQQQTKRAYLGLVLRNGEKKEVIPVVQNLSTLEYNLTSLIRKLTRPKTPVIGLLQGHDEPKVEEHLRQMYSLLSQTYELRPVTVGADGKLPADIDALFVVGPRKPVQANEQKAIDELVQNGKSVAFFLDNVAVEPRSFQQIPAEHGLGPLLTSYGITVGDQLVVDTQAANITISEQRGNFIVPMPVRYPFIPIVKHLESDSPISKGLSDITFPWASKVSATNADGHEVVVLARSSQKSFLDNKPPNLDPRRDWQSESDKISFNGPHELMLQISGQFKSPFNTPRKSDSTHIVVAGTSAVLQDEFMSQQQAALMMNVADWMLLDPALLAMRSRGLSLAQLKTDLTDGTRNTAKFGNAFGLPLALAALGLIRWRMREARRQSIAI
jgi:gliding-associated putative ABC transporter substrate-binding component GldG